MIQADRKDGRMGLTAQYLRYIEDAIEENLPKSSSLQMLELGDQVTRDTRIPEKTGKAYFENRGFTHTSVDLNGRHGAVVRDLRKPDQFADWHLKWDVITNSGTTEHVEPRESQFEAFGVIHDCTRVGGINVHLIPDVTQIDGRWRYHCTNYYSKTFFEMLVEECGYELRSNVILDGLRCAVIKKVEDGPFMTDRSRFLSEVSYRAIPFHRRVKRGVGDVLRRRGLRD
jgi:hypothetical protein